MYNLNGLAHLPCSPLGFPVKVITTSALAFFKAKREIIPQRRETLSISGHPIPKMVTSSFNQNPSPPTNLRHANT